VHMMFSASSRTELAKCWQRNTRVTESILQIDPPPTRQGSHALSGSLAVRNARSFGFAFHLHGFR